MERPRTTENISSERKNDGRWIVRDIDNLIHSEKKDRGDPSYGSIRIRHPGEHLAEIEIDEDKTPVLSAVLKLFESDLKGFIVIRDIVKELVIPVRMNAIAQKLDALADEHKHNIASEQMCKFWMEFAKACALSGTELIEFLKKKRDGEWAEQGIVNMVNRIREGKFEDWFLNDYQEERKVGSFNGRQKLRMAMAKTHTEMCKKCEGVAIVNHLFAIETPRIAPEIMSALGAQENANGTLCINTEELLPTDGVINKFKILKEKLGVLDIEQRKKVFSTENDKFWETFCEVCVLWYFLMKTFVGDE